MGVTGHLKVQKVPIKKSMKFTGFTIYFILISHKIAWTSTVFYLHSLGLKCPVTPTSYTNDVH